MSTTKLNIDICTISSLFAIIFMMHVCVWYMVARVVRFWVHVVQTGHPSNMDPVVWIKGNWIELKIRTVKVLLIKVSYCTVAVWLFVPFALYILSLRRNKRFIYKTGMELHHEAWKLPKPKLPMRLPLNPHNFGIRVDQSNSFFCSLNTSHRLYNAYEKTAAASLNSVSRDC